MSNLQFHKTFSGEGLFCPTEEDTQRAGAALASHLQTRTILSLEGPMGAGKTCFVKGLAKGLGCHSNDVSSPTFTIIHEYNGGRLPLVHMDLYRLKSADELEPLGLYDYLTEPLVAAIEWGGKFFDELPADTLRLEFSIEGSGRRIKILT